MSQRPLGEVADFLRARPLALGSALSGWVSAIRGLPENAILLREQLHASRQPRRLERLLRFLAPWLAAAALIGTAGGCLREAAGYGSSLYRAGLLFSLPLWLLSICALLWFMGRLHALYESCCGFLSTHPQPPTRNTVDDLLAGSAISEQELLVGLLWARLRPLLLPAGLCLLAGLLWAARGYASTYCAAQDWNYYSQSMYVYQYNAAPDAGLSGQLAISDRMAALAWQMLSWLLSMAGAGLKLLASTALALLLLPLLLISLSTLKLNRGFVIVGSLLCTSAALLLVLCSIQASSADYFGRLLNADYFELLGRLLLTSLLLLPTLLVLGLYLARRINWLRLGLLLLLVPALALHPLAFSLDGADPLDELLSEFSLGAAAPMLNLAFSPLQFEVVPSYLLNYQQLERRMDMDYAGYNFDGDVSGPGPAWLCWPYKPGAPAPPPFSLSLWWRWPLMFACQLVLLLILAEAARDAVQRRKWGHGQ